MNSLEIKRTYRHIIDDDEKTDGWPKVFADGIITKTDDKPAELQIRLWNKYSTTYPLQDIDTDEKFELYMRWIRDMWEKKKQVDEEGFRIGNHYTKGDK